VPNDLLLLLLLPPPLPVAAVDCHYLRTWGINGRMGGGSETCAYKQEEVVACFCNIDWITSRHAAKAKLLRNKHRSRRAAWKMDSSSLFPFSFLFPSSSSSSSFLQRGSSRWIDKSRLSWSRHLFTLRHYFRSLPFPNSSYTHTHALMDESKFFFVSAYFLSRLSYSTWWNVFNIRICCSLLYKKTTWI